MQTSLGVIIQSRRKLRRLTQAQLAEKLGVSRELVTMWESGLRVPGPQRRIALGDVLAFDASAYSAAAAPVCRRLRRWLRARVKTRRSRYPIGSTVAQVLRLGPSATAIHDDARRLLSDDDYNAVIETFPRDTRHELLFVLHVLRQAGEVVTTTPQRFGCPLSILDDFDSAYGGHHRQIAIAWSSAEEQMILFGQIRVLTSTGTAGRVDFLLYYRSADQRRGQWMHIELDGPPHAMSPNQDELRRIAIAIPEIRYDNVMVESVDFFNRLLSDVRKRAQTAAQWTAERKRAARRLRDQREEEAARRRQAS